ncbi:calcineurin-like phosphoesterase family protein [Saccharothrix carnea]|uniref:Calcineurin-like phosphoesterase family protein n=1 Tax=Saccharothrix carnea TaxID=1280637 RepID=A0A2P8I661_SACCR|nr:phosphodiesterase [Saccharothrix carnea]PSL53959.1 calcineurin-like phosphoesterase family protein [Saccharothrix carnea]
MLIAHLSDPHLRTDALAAEPAALLRLALGRVLALDPRPDCVVITGDLTEYGQVGAYEQLREVVGRFPLPLYLTTGNHDDPAALVEVFGGTSFLGGGDSAHYEVAHPGFTVVALDSWRPDGPAGRLGEEQLSWLDDVLSRRPEVPAFVCLHHPPVAVGIPFLDGMRLADGPALGEVLQRHGNVARVLAGHVHRPISVPFAGTAVAVAPSTYRQTSLTLRADQQVGYLAEPTGFLLHVATESGFATHTVAVSAAGALIGAF